MVYFSVEDCGVEANSVVAAGGQMSRPTFSIGEFGSVALCADTEGNHSDGAQCAGGTCTLDPRVGTHHWA